MVREKFPTPPLKHSDPSRWIGIPRAREKGVAHQRPSALSAQYRRSRNGAGWLNNQTP
ncbi:hypothetical protein bcgnr5380_63900 [Bacillus cereus]